MQNFASARTVLPQCGHGTLLGADGGNSEVWGSGGVLSETSCTWTEEDSVSGCDASTCERGMVAGISAPQVLQNLAPIRTGLPQTGHVADILTSWGQLADCRPEHFTPVRYCSDCTNKSICLQQAGGLCPSTPTARSCGWSGGWSWILPLRCLCLAPGFVLPFPSAVPAGSRPG